MASEYIEVLSVKEFANTTAGTLTDSAAGDILCDANIQIKFNGTIYWLPLYNTRP